MSGSSQIVWILAVGLFAGILSGMFGIGGGLVIVPALVIIMGFDQKTATGTSLFALLLPVGLLGVIDYHRQGKADLGYGLLIAPGLFLGAFLGARLTRGLDDMMLKRIYAGFLVIVACYYLLISTERGRAIVYGNTGAAVSKPKP